MRVLNFYFFISITERLSGKNMDLSGIFCLFFFIQHSYVEEPSIVNSAAIKSRFSGICAMILDE